MNSSISMIGTYSLILHTSKKWDQGNGGKDRELNQWYKPYQAGSTYNIRTMQNQKQQLNNMMSINATAHQDVAIGYMSTIMNAVNYCRGYMNSLHFV